MRGRLYSFPNKILGVTQDPYAIIVREAVVLALREDREEGDEDVLLYVPALPPP